MADATPSPLTTPNPLKKPFKVAELRSDLSFDGTTKNKSEATLPFLLKKEKFLLYLNF
ncbi:hypothetical protein V2I28_05435 [Campylobacter sp. CX2-4080-23]|uniref:hypothetical protein n=1 Tax=Campylobacter porcelli TaxID=1660073 RepID=UPI002EBD0472|nr:hypothetical protein [Campylobacter sp. CX2-4080-23]